MRLVFPILLTILAACDAELQIVTNCDENPSLDFCQRPEAVPEVSSTRKVLPFDGILSNLPGSPSQDEALNVLVSGEYFDVYQYRLVKGTASCEDLSLLDDWIAGRTAISTALDEDGPYTLCVMGRPEDPSPEDPVYVTSYQWTKDTAPAVGSISLAGGASYASSHQPSLSLTESGGATAYRLCSGPAGAGEDCAGELRPWSPFEETPEAYDFGSDGIKTLYVQFRDEAGNISTSASASIILDRTLPGDPSGVSVPLLSNGDVSVNFTAGAELNPADFQVKACENSDCASACVAASAGSFAGSPGTLADQGMSDGTAYYACVRAVDLAGNLSANWVASAAPFTYDTTPPSGTVLLAGGSALVSTRSPAISLSEAGGATGYQLCADSASAGSDCSSVLRAWSSFTTTPAAYDFPSDGLSTLYVQLRDGAGNISATFSDATTIDTLAPGSPSSVSAPSAANSDFSVSFTGGVEANPADFQLKACTSSDCSTGCVAGSASTTASSPGTIPVGALSSGSPYYACVRGADIAGQTSAWVASSATTTYDVTPPTVSLGSLPLDPSNDENLAVTVGGPADLVDYQYKLVSGAGSCTGGGYNGTWISKATSITGAIGPEGDYLLCVLGRDAVGNIQAEGSATSYSWTKGAYWELEVPTTGAEDMTVNFEGGASDITIQWGDGQESTASAASMTHSYGGAGVYTMRIKGTATNINFDNSDAKNRLTGILSPVRGIAGITSFKNLFRGCTALTGTIPSGLFSRYPAAESFNGTFREASGLSGSIPADLFVNNSQVVSFQQAFLGATGLTGSIPAVLFATNTAVTTFNGVFSGATGLTGSIPSGLFDNNTLVTSFANAFYGATGITAVPADILDRNTSVVDLTGTFRGMTGVTSDVPQLWLTFPGASSGGCFNGTVNATNYASIPAGWL